MVIVPEKKLTFVAERLFITQPAVSLALKRLENTLGVKLLLRGNKFETTLAGEAAYKETCKVYAINGRIHTELDQAPILKSFSCFLSSFLFTNKVSIKPE